MDCIYDFFYICKVYFSYKELIFVFEMIKYLVIIMCGCFGGCIFCLIIVY